MKVNLISKVATFVNEKGENVTYNKYYVESNGIELEVHFNLSDRGVVKKVWQL